MRKQDYSLLASMIRVHLEQLREARDNSPDVLTINRACAAIVELEILAHNFARSASVDRRAFILACGL